jgi:hypothetical protein
MRRAVVKADEWPTCVECREVVATILPAIPLRSTTYDGPDYSLTPVVGLRGWDYERARRQRLVDERRERRRQRHEQCRAREQQQQDEARRRLVYVVLNREVIGTAMGNDPAAIRRCVTDFLCRRVFHP